MPPLGGKVLSMAGGGVLTMAGPFVLSMAGGGSARRGRLARRGNARPCGRPGGRASYRIAALWRPQHPGPRTALSLRHGPAARSAGPAGQRPRRALRLGPAGPARPGSGPALSEGVGTPGRGPGCCGAGVFAGDADRRHPANSKPRRRRSTPQARDASRPQGAFLPATQFCLCRPRCGFAFADRQTAAQGKPQRRRTEPQARDASRPQGASGAPRVRTATARLTAAA